MTEDEVTDLLTYMASFDKRTLGDADIDAWAPIMQDLPFPDAMEAVARHYGRDSTEFMMPKHIRDGVKAIRAERIAKSVIPAPPAELCDNPRAYQQALQEATREAGDGRGLPATGQPPAIVGDGQRVQLGQPATLRQAIAGLRRELGPARRRVVELPGPQAALEQAEDSRARRDADGHGQAEGQEAS